MAIQHLPVVHFPPPDTEQAAALRTTGAYLHQAGTQIASLLLGFPQVTPETATLAEFGTLMLRGAALCEGVLELVDELDRQ